MQYLRILCKYYQELGVFGAKCNSKEGCIYGNHQSNNECIKGCKVNGLIDSGNIPKDKKEKLTEQDLETKVTINL